MYTLISFLDFEFEYTQKELNSDDFIKIEAKKSNVLIKISFNSLYSTVFNQYPSEKTLISPIIKLLVI